MRISTADGRPASTYVDGRRAARKHFTEVLAATHGSFVSSLLDAERDSMSAVAEEVAAILKELCAIPGLGSLILKFRRSASKAVGGDLLGGELFAAASDSIARIFHPIVCKAASTFKFL